MVTRPPRRTPVPLYSTLRFPRTWHESLNAMVVLVTSVIATFLRPVGGSWAERKRMNFTRRDLGKLALVSVPVSMALGAKMIDSKFGGVQIGAITYSFNRIASPDPEAIIKPMWRSGSANAELMSNHCEALAGAPAMPAFGRGGGAGRAPAGPARSARRARPKGGGGGGRAQLTPSNRPRAGGHGETYGSGGPRPTPTPGRPSPKNSTMPASTSPCSATTCRTA